MADTKISALTAYAGTAVVAGTDVMPIVDIANTTTKKIVTNQLVIALTPSQATMDAGSSTTTLVTPALNRIALGTEVATTSGTAVNFTSLPSGTRRLTLMLKGVSTNGSSNLILQLGDSAGGVQTSNYLGTCNNSSTALNSSSGFLLTVSIGSANVMHGKVTIELESGQTWICTSTIGFSDSAGSSNISAGSYTLTTGPLDRVRLTTVNGTDAFDAGAINISYER